MTDNERRRVRLFGPPQSAEAYAVRDYLQRSVPELYALRTLKFEFPRIKML